MRIESIDQLPEAYREQARAQMKGATVKKNLTVAQKPTRNHPEQDVRFDITIPMRPVAKGRPRVVANGKHTFTPQKTVDAEQTIQQYCRPVLKDWQAEGPIWLNAYFVYKGPRKLIRTYRTEKPDIDNLVKLVMDGLKPWLNDALVTNLCSWKRWGLDDYVRIQIGLADC